LKRELPLPIRIVIAMGASVIWLMGWTLSFVGEKKEAAEKRNKT
jgi:hypothetical protein